MGRAACRLYAFLLTLDYQRDHPSVADVAQELRPVAIRAEWGCVIVAAGRRCEAGTSTIAFVLAFADKCHFRDTTSACLAR